MSAEIAEYFQGERNAGAVVAAVGIASIGVASWLYRRIRDRSERWGFVGPAGVLGLGATVGGVWLAARSSRQADELSALHGSDPVAFLDAELPRMAAVNANWGPLKLTWICVLIMAAGFFLATKIDWVRAGWVRGVCIVMFTYAALLLLLDVTAESRAAIYTTWLDSEAVHYVP